MITFLTIIHILCALVLILVILLQSAKGTDLAGAFGGMGSQTAFGPRGTTTFLSKTTAVLAAIFMVTSVSLAVLSNRIRRGGSVLSGEKAVPITQPANPAAPAAPAPPVPQPTVKIIPAPKSGAKAATPAPAIGDVKVTTPPASSTPSAPPPGGESKPESSGASPGPAEAPAPGAPSPQPSGQ